MTNQLWIFADTVMFVVFTLAAGQVLRHHQRKIFENHRRIKTLEEQHTPRLPHCFSTGAVMTAQGQAEHNCPQCMFVQACLDATERKKAA